MASRLLSSTDSYIFIESEDEVASLCDSNFVQDRDYFPLLLDEVRRTYNVRSDSDFQTLEITQTLRQRRHEERVEDELEKGINSLIDQTPEKRKSCASCSKCSRVECVSSFKKGQHLSMPGQYIRKYDEKTRKLKALYRHHAIVKEVKTTSGSKVQMSLVHFTSQDNEIRIYESEETYDLVYDEINIIDYVHPGGTPEEILKRAESMLPENRKDKKEFGKYNVVTNNCEHFATWCVVGKGQSFQVESVLKLLIEKGLRCVFGDSSKILKGILRLLYNSSDEIAARLTKAIHVPEIIIGLTAALYLIYCIIQTVVHKKENESGTMCRSCLKAKLTDLWLGFGAFGATSMMSFVLFNFLLPMMTPQVNIPLQILLILLSVAFQWSIPDITKALRSPFSVDKNPIEKLSELNIGDIISLPYYGLSHDMVVTEVHGENTKGRIRCIHYGLPSLFGKRTIMKEYFQVDLAQSKVELYECRHLALHNGLVVAQRAKKRIGETKWAIGSNRSDHFCYWAKIKKQDVQVGLDDVIPLPESKSKCLSSLFVEEVDVHLMEELQLGDVVQIKNQTGILVKMTSFDHPIARKFEVEIIVYGHGYAGRSNTLSIDLNRDQVLLKRYHPSQCHPMAKRVERAKYFEGRKCKWWTTTGFIENCIMLHPEG